MRCRNSVERNGADKVELLARLAAHLLAHEPDDAEFRLTHGDTNAGNYLFRDDTVAAIVDWELSAIGDPRSDLGFYAALNTVFGGYGAGRSPLTDAYAAATGRPLKSMEFYEAWGLYRMLMIFGGSRGWWHPYGTEAALHRLAAACPGAELWITDTARFATDAFGTHIKSYRYDPKPYVERVKRDRHRRRCAKLDVVNQDAGLVSRGHK